MAIDPELERALGLTEGALKKRRKDEFDWRGRLMNEVIDPFNEIMRAYKDSFERRGLSRESDGKLINEAMEFHEDVNKALAALVCIYTACNVGPEDEMLELGITVITKVVEVKARKLMQEAKKGKRG